MTQRIRLLSDLHQEFGPLEDIPELPEDKHTVMVLAGDIGLATKTHTYIPLLAECESRFAQTIYVLGNHEYYHSSLIRARDKIQDACDYEGFEKIHVWDDSGIYTRYKVAFIGCTLWTDFDKANPHAMMMAREGMNDYRCIRTGSAGVPYLRKSKPSDTLALHNQMKPWLLRQIKKFKKDGYRVVVITHHLPSYQCVPEQFKGDRFNCCYASELGYDVCDLEPDVWFFGHTHDSVNDYIHNTRVICNPRGYVGHETNPNFDPSLRIDV